jgi:hypothetical protein
LGGNKAARRLRNIVAAAVVRDNAVDSSVILGRKWSKAMTKCLGINAFVAVLFASAAVQAAESQSAPPTAGDDSGRHRSFSAIDDDLHEALRAEAVSRRQRENTREVIRLIELYREMAAHPKRHSSPLLAQMGLRLRSRLEKVREHVERQLAREERNAKKKDPPPNLAIPTTTVLAQQLPAPGGAVPAPGGQLPGAGAGGIFDYGPDLVELIQATISPSTWDINGGNASIVYYAPLRVLVVSAPGEVHGQVGDVLGQLRAAP